MNVRVTANLRINLLLQPARSELLKLLLRAQSVNTHFYFIIYATVH
jgi:hypothetical protein